MKTFDLQDLYQKLNRDLIEMSLYDLLNPNEEIEIEYKPDYQRNYIWNNTKAIELVETVLINGEIPPLTVVKRGKILKVIDGRQRYQTVNNFYNNKFKLEMFGLKELKDLSGLKYCELPKNMRKIFDEYKLKMILYTEKEKMTDEELDYLERDLFRRYNNGMTALTKYEIARAMYDGDFLTEELISFLEKNNDLYEKAVNILLSKSKRELEDRERMNLLLVVIRELLIMQYIPIIGEKNY